MFCDKVEFELMGTFFSKKLSRFVDNDKSCQISDF